MDKEAPLETDELVLPSKRQLLRDALVFQVKLIVDGIRDFVLIPVSLIATVLSLLKSGDKAGSEFYDVVAFGKETEDRINLFGAAANVRPRPNDLPSGDLDQMIDRVERYVSTELSGERFNQARDKMEDLVDRLRRQKSGEGDEHDESK